MNFVEKIYHDVDNSKKNYDLLGGWICGSPLQNTARWEYVAKNEDGVKENNIEKALLTENFYFVMEESGDTSFLTDYYRFKGIETELEIKDTVGAGENPFVVYKLVKSEK